MSPKMRATCFGRHGMGTNEDETPVETLVDWQVNFADSASDLPF